MHVVVLYKSKRKTIIRKFESYIQFFYVINLDINIYSKK